MGTNCKSLNIVAVFGVGAMILLSLTQLVPNMLLAGYAVIFGILAFFADCIISGRIPRQCGLSFTNLFEDMRKPGVFFWLFVPVVTAILPNLIGDSIFHNGFSASVLEHAGRFLSYDNFWLLLAELVVLSIGEEIAWRGFFVGRTMQAYPFWICMAGSSFLFALGHMGSIVSPLVLFNLFFVFIDSCVFTVIYKKSGNCAVSAVSHILGNIVGLMVCFSMA